MFPGSPGTPPARFGARECRSVRPGIPPEQRLRPKPTAQRAASVDRRVVWNILEFKRIELRTIQEITWLIKYALICPSQKRENKIVEKNLVKFFF